MARIKIVDEQNATGMQAEILRQAREQAGYIPGVLKILLPDLQLAQGVNQIYEHLQFREDSPLSRIQREMVATVVNGLVAGAP